MPDVYGVTAADVAAELPGIFKDGFTQASKPSLATVTAWITDADTYIDTVVRQVVAVNADLSEPATRLARCYVLDDTILRTYRAMYAGRVSPADLASLTAGLGGKPILDQINALATSEIAAALAALEEAQLTAPRLAVNPPAAARDLLITDIDLDPHLGGGRF